MESTTEPSAQITHVKLSSSESLSLDFIRALAAQAVVVGHALGAAGIYPWPTVTHPFYMQNLAVVVFFVLSGFLIAYSVSAKQHVGDYGPASYFADRFVRIFSAYWPALIFILLVDGAFIAIAGFENYGFKTALNVRTFMTNVFMLQDYAFADNLRYFLRGTSLGSGRPLWTVAIEWWIYLLFGFIVLHRKLNIPTPLKLMVLAGLLIVPIENLNGRGNGLTLAWFLGAAVYLLRPVLLQLRVSSDVRALAFVILAIGFFVRLRTMLFDVYDPTLFALLAAGLLCLLVGLHGARGPARPSRDRMIRFFADYSFSLYLTHYTVIAVVAEFQRRAPMPREIEFLVAVLASNAVAIAFAYVTEFHHKRIRHAVARRFAV